MRYRLALCICVCLSALAIRAGVHASGPSSRCSATSRAKGWDGRRRQRLSNGCKLNDELRGNPNRDGQIFCDGKLCGLTGRPASESIRFPSSSTSLQ